MRYLAQRTTGEWLDRDLPLTNVERTRELSGPGGITATIEPELRQTWMADGKRLIDDWSTIIYATEDDGAIRNAALVVPSTGYEGAATQLTTAGFATVPRGFIYDRARNWGPDKANPKTAKPEVPRPDPLQIVQDHWAYIQDQPDCDLGVRFVGDLTSTVRIGTYEEPYRLRWWENPDLGSEIDTLAGETPFDYVEEHSWANDAHTDVDHRIRLGWPRLGRRRDDLRFASGENISLAVTAGTTEDYANDIIGIGNGEGSKMVWSRSTVRDGRLRRTRIITDKTITSKARMDKLVRDTRERLSATVDISSVALIDHPNARLSNIQLGDDIYVQVEIESYGDLAMWVRVLAITQGEDSHTAVLSTQRSSAFLYSATAELAQ